jgi:tripartite-type tricarboxylate transporter receptor subunit TctC
MKKHFAFLFAASLLSLSAAAQTTYPSKPVKLMVGAGAGGGTDIIARMLAEKMTESLKGTFIVENKPGASNTIAADLTAKASPDGHTLLVATNTGQAIAPHLIKLSFDPIKDLTPIGLVVTVPNVLVVGSNVPANNVKELVALMKAKPEDFKYASSGVGSTQHIAGEGFDIAAGVKSVHVPYKGSTPGRLAVVQGEAHIMFDGLLPSLPLIKQGRLRPLAVTGLQRSAVLPELPTIAETLPGYRAETWYALFAPARTPPAIVKTLNEAVATGLKRAEVRQRLHAQGAEPAGTSPDQLATLLKQETALWRKVIKDAGITAQ